MEAGTESSRQDQLEQKLEALLGQELFPPPASFVADALLNDPAVYEQADADFQGWWESHAESLDWSRRWDQVLDDSNPPFYKWFTGGKLNVSHNCLDRHVENGLGDRVAFHWRGEEGEERDVTYAELLADTKRLANALKDRGVGAGDVVGIYLPMIPEVAVAMLACARIGAPHNVVFGGFAPESVKERMEFSEAKALITANAARRKGKSAPVKPAVDGFLGDVPSIETVVVVQNTGDDTPMTEGRDLWYHEALAGRSRMPGRAARRRAPAVRALHVGLDRKAQGHPAHHGRLPHRCGGHHQARLRPQAGEGRVLVLGRRRLGHRPQLHRLRAPGQRCDLGDVRRRARLPRQGHLVGAVRALRRVDLLHGARPRSARA